MKNLTEQVQTSTAKTPKIQVRCKNHPRAHLIQDYRYDGDLMCPTCGLVFQSGVANPGFECKSYNEKGNADDTSRVGGPENPHLNGMINRGLGEAAFDEYGAAKCAKYQNRLNDSSDDRILMNAFKNIAAMSERLSIPETIANRANNLFKTFREKRGTNGRVNSKWSKSSNSAATAALYIACRLEEIPRTFKEIVGCAEAFKKDVSRAYRTMMKDLEIPIESVTTDNFMDRFCSNLNLPMDVKEAASVILRKAIDIDIAPGRSRIQIIAAAIYMASQASKQKHSQKEISKVVGVPYITIRQVYRMLYPKAEVLFPRTFIFATPIDQLPLL